MVKRETTAKLEPFEKRHRDGSLWAKGFTLKGKAEGYWEWFRKDGTKMRSGHFMKGRQVGEWITYDRQSRIHTKTMLSED